MYICIFCPKIQSIDKFRPHQMTYVTACVTALARKRQNSNKLISGFFGGDGLILWVTLYHIFFCILQNHVFFYNQDSFFERELSQNGYKQKWSVKKWDVNIGKCVHITPLLPHWTKVLDGMLFRGPLPFLTKPDLQQWMLLWLNITRSWYVLHFIMDVLMCTAYTNLANTFLISFPSKNSDLSSMLEA